MPISHDPSNREYRFPQGAVPAGTQVDLLLRFKPSAKEGVREVLLETGECDAIPMEPCEEGYRASIDTSGEPRVMFYRFRVLTDTGEIICAPRTDGKSTFGRGFRIMGNETPDSIPQGFQLTVYDPAFTSPEWFKGSVMYQVFPDRFARSGDAAFQRGAELHARRGWPVKEHDGWNEPPVWSEPYDPVDFFGGNFLGIEEKLDYLRSLGVSTLYLNPIVEARSNHRYNTGDYESPDPILGTWDDYERLAKAASEHGIRIVLDTVLSHTGASSKYFNLDDSYDSYGAAQGNGSPYRTWYDFTDTGFLPPYRAWWGDATLPEVEERDHTWQEYILGPDVAGDPPEDEESYDAEMLVLHGGNGFVDDDYSFDDIFPSSPEEVEPIIPMWIRHGTGGLRLDVADEIPDDVLELIRKSARGADGECVIIGEVWEDPTTKESYGTRRTYALGRSLDSVMNYPLRSALLQFALEGTDALQLVTFLKGQKSNYPAPMYEGLMNLLSSHDVERIRSVLALGREFRDLPRDEQKALTDSIYAGEDARGAELQAILATIVYTLPGVPCLYYGDERGMQGGRDPFDRATFPWGVEREDCGRDLTDLYQRLGTLRTGSDALRYGSSAFYAYGHDVVAVLRAGADGAFVAVANRGVEECRFAIDLVARGSSIDHETELQIRYAHTTPVVIFSTADDNAEVEYSDGVISSSIGPKRAVIYHLDIPGASRKGRTGINSQGVQEAQAQDGPNLKLACPLQPGIGVICHITSVPNDKGHGTFGEPSRRFVDKLAEAGVTYWQILPLNPADEYGSPYAGLSAFAGNTHLLESEASGFAPSPRLHPRLGDARLLRNSHASHAQTVLADSSRISFASAIEGDVANPEASCGFERPASSADPCRAPFASAIEGDVANSHASYEGDLSELPEWLLTYATFTAIKRVLGEVPWQMWPEEYRAWSPDLATRPELAGLIREEVASQLEFERQWHELRSYANERGIKVIGDMPIYVSADSADAWAHPEYFMLDKNGNVALEGGVPPDQFAADGQRWGSPVYNCDMLRLCGYDWWLDRMERMFQLYDYVRIDHFLGFNSYYAIPAGGTAADGAWHPGPGLDFFHKAYDRFGPLPVIAEDLGIITPEVVKLVEDTGFPGMDVIQFADGEPRFDWHPKPGKMVFTGTHDTQTLVGWAKGRFFSHIPDDAQALAEARKVAAEMMDKAYDRHSEGAAPVLMIPLQDVFGLGDESRMNVPGTAGENWHWQATQAQMDGFRIGKPSFEGFCDVDGNDGAESPTNDTDVQGEAGFAS